MRYTDTLNIKHDFNPPQPQPPATDVADRQAAILEECDTQLTDCLAILLSIGGNLNMLALDYELGRLDTAYNAISGTLGAVRYLLEDAPSEHVAGNSAPVHPRAQVHDDEDDDDEDEDEEPPEEEPAPDPVEPGEEAEEEEPFATETINASQL